MLLRKNIIMILTVGTISLALTWISLEIFARCATFSSGAQLGLTDRRWRKKNWHPINRIGFRDFEVGEVKKTPQVVFLGDSFTAGYGVKFDETFYFLSRSANPTPYQFVNLGKLGASTEQEAKTLSRYLTAFKPELRTVIHQYLGNDIQSRMTMPKVDHRLPARLRVRSEGINFLDNLLFSRELGGAYFEALYHAYRDKNLLALHLADLKKLHTDIRKQKANLVFLVFPFLDNDQITARSAEYIKIIRNYFNETCAKNDIFVDVTPLVEKLSPRERVASCMDAHPSAQLHQLVSEVLIGILQKTKLNQDMVHLCPSDQALQDPR